MKKLLLSTLAVAGVGSALTGSAQAQAEQPNPRQYVVVISEATSPAVLELGKNYLRKADEDPELTIAFDDLQANGKTSTAGADALTQLQGLLSTAEKNGFKTGLVTTGDLTTVAPLFYNLNGTTADALADAQAQYDFLGGAGGSKLTRAGATLKAANGSYIPTVDDLTDDIKDRVLITQNADSLNYAIDRDPLTEISLSEVATLAMDTLSVDNSPFVLVIHDTMLKKALDARDTPALFEQFRELDTIVSEALRRHNDENPNLAVTTLLTGNAITPRWPANVNVSNSYFILSKLTRSFAGVGKTLKGADTETIDAFADAESGEYPGWKLSAADKAKFTAGTLDPEVAVRAAYEPAIKLEYASVATTPTVYTVGLEVAPNASALAALSAAVATPAR